MKNRFICICTNKRKIKKIKSTYLERIYLLFLLHKLMYFKHFKILSPETFVKKSDKVLTL